MTQEIVPKSGSWISEVSEKFNLPQLLFGEAGKAISRLIGETADIPSVWIKRYTQGVADGTTSRTIVSKALAESVAKTVSVDADIVERAAEVLLAKELRKQINREAIAKKTIELLPAPGDLAESPQAKIDDDWLNVFARYAEEATSERLRDLWARVLSGEIRQPNKFSLRTLRFIAELDQDTAQNFESHLGGLLANNMLLRDVGLRGQSFSKLLQLQEVELLTGVGSTIDKLFEFHDTTVISINHLGNKIILTAPENTEYRIRAHLLTSVGVQIASIISKSPSLEDTKLLAQRLPKENLLSISVTGPITSQGEPSGPTITVWEKS